MLPVRTISTTSHSSTVDPLTFVLLVGEVVVGSLGREMKDALGDEGVELGEEETDDIGEVVVGEEDVAMERSATVGIGF